MLEYTFKVTDFEEIIYMHAKVILMFLPKVRLSQYISKCPERNIFKESKDKKSYIVKH